MAALFDAKQKQINKPDSSVSEDFFSTPEKAPGQVEKPPKLPEKEEKEKEKEKAEKKYFKTKDEDPEKSPYVIKSSRPTPDPKKGPAKSKTLEAVEEILTDDMDQLYESMDEKKKQEFKAKGEEVASAINEMVTGFKVRARKVVYLVKQWLSIIPRVNKYFLEQEAKIKTQKILSFGRKYKRENKKKKW